MQKPELVLSNTTSFFFGGIKAAFQNAQKFGFKYLEIIPYRWTTPAEILQLEQQYGIQVIGIHLPVWWQHSLADELKRQTSVLGKFFTFVWQFYLGAGVKSPALQIVKALREREPYVLFHTSVVAEMGKTITQIAQKFHLVIENVPYEAGLPNFFWNPVEILKTFQNQGLKTDVLLDLGHFHQSMRRLPKLDLFETYRQTRPEVIHISYNSHGIHLLPDQKEQTELVTLLKIHSPRYIVLETNPLVSIKRGKALLEKLIAQAV